MPHGIVKVSKGGCRYFQVERICPNQSQSYIMHCLSCISIHAKILIRCYLPMHAKNPPNAELEIQKYLSIWRCLCSHDSGNTFSFVPHFLAFLLNSPHGKSNILQSGDNIDNSLVDSLEISIVGFSPLPRK